MRTIPLTQGKVALVDDEDFDRVNQFKWCCGNFHGKYYAYRGINRNHSFKTVYMHRFILQHSERHTDHIDGNTLNNQKSNLRPASAKENYRNQKLRTTNTTGFKGVYFNPDSKVHPFCAQIRAGEQIYLGCFATAIEAASAYDEAAMRLHGTFASTNRNLGLLPAHQT